MKHRVAGRFDGGYYSGMVVPEGGTHLSRVEIGIMLTSRTIEPRARSSIGPSLVFLSIRARKLYLATWDRIFVSRDLSLVVIVAIPSAPDRDVRATSTPFCPTAGPPTVSNVIANRTTKA
jgi:hypothetical protein